MLIRQHECHILITVTYTITSLYVPTTGHCLLIGYDASRCDEKMNMLIFRRSRIEAESQYCNRRFSPSISYRHRIEENRIILSERPSLSYI